MSFWSDAWNIISAPFGGGNKPSGVKPSDTRDVSVGISTPYGSRNSGEVPAPLLDVAQGPKVTVGTTATGQSIGIPIITIPTIAGSAYDLAASGAAYAIENPLTAAQTGLTAYSYYKNPKKLLSDLGVPDLSKYIPQSKPSYDPFQGVVNNQNAPDQTAVFVSNQSKAGALFIFAAVAGITFLMLKKKGK